MKTPVPEKPITSEPSDEAGSLPHERDQGQGTDPTSGIQPGTRDVIRQAQRDIESGQEDTDMHDQRSLEKTQRKA
jgi:hypothetical protein